VTLDTSDTALRIIRRRLKDADVYLFFNEGPEALSRAVTVRSEGKTAELWDVQTAKIVTTKATGEKGTIRMQLDMKPYETTVLIVR
jgi:hypothetical protein